MDKTTKILLAAIALGLWANAGIYMLRPAVAQSELISSYLRGIELSMRVIADGLCKNNKIC